MEIFQASVAKLTSLSKQLDLSPSGNRFSKDCLLTVVNISAVLTSLRDRNPVIAPKLFNSFTTRFSDKPKITGATAALYKPQFKWKQSQCDTFSSKHYDCTEKRLVKTLGARKRTGRNWERRYFEPGRMRPEGIGGLKRFYVFGKD